MTVIAPRSGLTRPEAYEWANALHAAGWPYRRIAGELCISQSYVRDLLNDPTGEKARARKRRAGGVCEDCGEPTSYGKAGEGPSRRCERCMIAEARAACYWTNERVLKAAREWRRLHGDWPTVTVWRRAQTLGGYRFPPFSACYAPNPDAPSRKYRDRPWRSWAAFLVAAGADADDVGMARTARAGTATLRACQPTNCSGCGCRVDAETPGCRNCYNRHRQRRLSLGAPS